jgi:lysophospholipase L1-like esterase
MRIDSVELHNIEEARRTPGEEGLLLQRVPESVRQKLCQGAAQMMLMPANSEIRFAIEGDGEAAVTLSGAESQVRGAVFFGGFFTTQRFALSPTPATIRIKMPEPLRSVPDRIGKQQVFSLDVCRVMLPYLAGTARFHGVEGPVRPPAKGETPSLRMLSYGTSITHGAFATASHLTYAAQAARRLDADLLNLGVGGSCHCEPALADYIAERDDWDFATLCLSVNMLGFGFSAADFRERTRYFIQRLATTGRKRLVACITLFPFFGDVGRVMPSAKATPEEFRQILREVVAQLDLANVVLLEGPDLLTRWAGLAADMIHPADDGMIEIGENLAARLRPLLPAAR